MSPNLILFGLIAGVAALCAVGVVAFNSPVRSALCLVLNFFMLAALYFTLRAEMLGITQVVVYTGAIMVLFLFVIMLLNLGVPQPFTERHDWKKPVGLLLGTAMFAMLASQILPALGSITVPKSLDEYGSPNAIGHTLFTQYAYPFESVSILLLIGIVGSILLAKRKI